jgi:hypothetical protein
MVLLSGKRLAVVDYDVMVKVKCVTLLHSGIVLNRRTYDGPLSNAVVKLPHLKTSVDVDFKTSVCFDGVVDFLF